MAAEGGREGGTEGRKERERQFTHVLGGRARGRRQPRHSHLGRRTTDWQECKLVLPTGGERDHFLVGERASQGNKKGDFGLGKVNALVKIDLYK